MCRAKRNREIAPGFHRRASDFSFPAEREGFSPLSAGKRVRGVNPSLGKGRRAFREFRGVRGTEGHHSHGRLPSQVWRRAVDRSADFRQGDRRLAPHSRPLSRRERGGIRLHPRLLTCEGEGRIRLPPDIRTASNSPGAFDSPLGKQPGGRVILRRQRALRGVTRLVIKGRFGKIPKRLCLFASSADCGALVEKRTYWARARSRSITVRQSATSRARRGSSPAMSRTEVWYQS
jgi:hypothetical protein